MKTGKAVVVRKLFLETDSIYVHHTAIEARQPVGSRGVVAEPVPLHDSQLWFVRMDNGKNAVYHEGELEISGEPVKKKVDCNRSLSES